VTNGTQTRPLGDVPVLALFLDGVYEPLRAQGVRREAVLVAWAITLEGKKLLLSLALGNRESAEAWRDFSGIWWPAGCRRR
jgi:transposase-like protein